MKRLFNFLLVVILLTTNAYSQVKVTGRLVDDKQEPVMFANVVLQSEEVFYGTSSDEDGNFELKPAPGSYILKISSISYESYNKEISISSDISMGEIVMAESSLELGEVVVRAERVVRMPDRFVVNLANNPAVVGKLGTDVLNLSPGVFVQESDGSISINGKSGTKVYVNERPRNESGTELIQYLRTLKAEDIIKIEVLPTAGAEYDANIQGGVIKIMLKRQRDDGAYGYIGADYKFATHGNAYNFDPSFGINYKNNRFSLYSQLNYNQFNITEHVTEETRYTDRIVQSMFDGEQTRKTPSARIGAIYDIKDNQSVGIEGNYSHRIIIGRNPSELTDISAGSRTEVNSLYEGKTTTDNYSASANYILRFGPSGSTFKVLLDYFHNESDNNQDYNSEFRGFRDYDTIYRSNMYARNDMYAVSVDLSFQLKNQSTFATGLKYIHNKMDNDILFEYLKETNWYENEPYSYESRYTENIAAVYGTFSSRIKKVSYSLGLRGEYTSVSPWINKSDQTEDQSYFDLFPTVFVMLPLGEKNQHSLVLNYNRKIQRPHFAFLNPFRTPGNEYLFLEGNPKLKPALFNDFSTSLRLFNRYNIVAGITDAKETFEQVFQTDPNAPGVIVRRTENVGNRRNYYISANTFLSPVKWWQIMLNVSGNRSEVTVFDSKRTIETFLGSVTNMFTLPNNLMLDITGFYRSPVIEGNSKMTMDPQVGVALRKEFFNRRLSMKLYADNIFDTGIVRMETIEKNFNREMRVRYSYRQFGLSFRYNFRAGKSIQVKNVESGAADEKARLQ